MIINLPSWRLMCRRLSADNQSLNVIFRSVNSYYYFAIWTISLSHTLLQKVGRKQETHSRTRSITLSLCFWLVHALYLYTVFMSMSILVTKVVCPQTCACCGDYGENSWHLFILFYCYRNLDKLKVVGIYWAIYLD